MADHTKIEWADATVNAVNGCSLVSPGCTNCYAMKLAGTRMKHHPSRAGLTRPGKAGPVWTGEVRLSESQLLQPLRWKRPRRIFWNAHGDLFHENVPDAWIDRVFAVAAPTPQHTHMILTKRPARMREYFAAHDVSQPGDSITTAAFMMNRAVRGYAGQGGLAQWPLPNVWLGVSVEDQTRKTRIDDLRNTPAAVRFISAEPLLEYLGEVDLTGIDWVIVGGESGPNARPMHPDWARTLRDQCAAAGVAFHFKQWGGEWGPDTGPRDDCHPGTTIRRDPIMEGKARCAVRVGDAWQCFDNGYGPPIELCSGHGEHVYRLGKKANGRLLDGVEHNGMPDQALRAFAPSREEI